MAPVLALVQPVPSDRPPIDHGRRRSSEVEAGPTDHCPAGLFICLLPPPARAARPPLDNKAPLRAAHSPLLHVVEGGGCYSVILSAAMIL